MARKHLVVFADDTDQTGRGGVHLQFTTRTRTVFVGGEEGPTNQALPIGISWFWFALRAWRCSGAYRIAERIQKNGIMRIPSI